MQLKSLLNNSFFTKKPATTLGFLSLIVLLIASSNANVFCAIDINTAEKHLQSQNYKEAIDAYNTLINAVDTVAELYYGRGLANYYLDLLDSAISDFTHSIALKASNNAFLGLANSYVLKQQYDNAIKIINKRLNTDTTDNLLYCRAITHFMNENYKAAANDFEKTISLTNKDLTNYHYATYGKAIANYKLQNYSKAKPGLEECILQNKLESNYIAKCKELLLYIDSM